MDPDDPKVYGDTSITDGLVDSQNYTQQHTLEKLCQYMWVFLVRDPCAFSTLLILKDMSLICLTLS